MSIARFGVWVLSYEEAVALDTATKMPPLEAALTIVGSRAAKQDINSRQMKTCEAILILFFNFLVSCFYFKLV